jgi:hypothetical protein
VQDWLAMTQKMLSAAPEEVNRKNHAFTVGIGPALIDKDGRAQEVDGAE